MLTINDLLMDEFDVHFELIHKSLYIVVFSSTTEDHEFYFTLTKEEANVLARNARALADSLCNL